MQRICIAFNDMNSVKLAYCTGIEERIYLFCEDTFMWPSRCVRYVVCDISVIVVLTMCNLTISSILQNPTNTYIVHAYINLRGDEGVKQCTSTLRACSFTA